MPSRHNHYNSRADTPPGTDSRENRSAMIARLLRFAGAVLLVLYSALSAAQTGTITLAEGALRLLRGPSVMLAGEGVQIQPGDILETDDRGISVVEFADGLLLGLGPRTRLYLADVSPRLRRDESGQPIILLAGWCKLQAGKQAPADGYRVLAAALGVSTGDARLLAHAAEQRASLFLESGAGRLLEPDEQGKTTKTGTLAAGQFASRVAAQRTSLQPRPDAAFLAGMPKGFRDALPARPDRLKANPKAPKFDHDVRYDEVKDWLQMPQSWRGELVRRFTVRLRDADFRKALAANLAHHPEWQPILYPPQRHEAGHASSRNRDSQQREQAQ